MCFYACYKYVIYVVKIEEGGIGICGGSPEKEEVGILLTVEGI